MTNYNVIRRRSKEIRIGKLAIGAENPIAVQSMVNVSGYDAVYAQMRALEDAGCDIIRMTVPDLEAARVLAQLKESDITMPIVAEKLRQTFPDVEVVFSEKHQDVMRFY